MAHCTNEGVAAFGDDTSIQLSYVTYYDLLILSQVCVFDFKHKNMLLIADSSKLKIFPSSTIYFRAFINSNYLRK